MKNKFSLNDLRIRGGASVNALSLEGDPAFSVGRAFRDDVTGYLFTGHFIINRQLGKWSEEDKANWMNQQQEELLA